MTHYADLHDIDCPLGELAETTACRLIMAGVRGERIEVFLGGEWVAAQAAWLPGVKYRLARPVSVASPAPVADIIPWDAVHRDFNAHFRFRIGSGHFATKPPTFTHGTWISNSRSTPSAAFAGIIIGDKPWNQSLELRPDWEGK